jgi:predicted GH43/DUF377 family glycosyl hydrolase
MSVPSFFKVKKDNFKNITYIHKHNILTPSDQGFDSTGVLPTSYVEFNNKKHLYFSGWSYENGVYRNAIGHASSEDGIYWTKTNKSVLSDNTLSHGHPFCYKDEDIFFMFYGVCIDSKIIANKKEYIYNAKYAISKNGEDWDICGLMNDLTPKNKEAAHTRPSIVRVQSDYLMWVSVRDYEGYKDKPPHTYKLHCYKSKDLIKWQYTPEYNFLPDESSCWDNNMVEYSSVIYDNGRIHMLYNGNGFGQTGIGYATLDI